MSYGIEQEKKKIHAILNNYYINLITTQEISHTRSTGKDTGEAKLPVKALACGRTPGSQCGGSWVLFSVFSSSPKLV